MAKHWVVKLDGQDDNKDPVLIHVTSKGSEELDLDLVATESTTVFKGKLRKRKLKNLTAKNYNGKEDEWEAILRYVLLGGKFSTISDDQKRSLEAGASVQGKDGQKTLSITFRNRIDDITQRIGAIELSQDDEEQISLFDWTALAVDKNKTLEEELTKLSITNDKYKAAIVQLQSQLADLVKAKAEHEEQLLSKFVLLLNEKKLKIRDQQRILQAAVKDKDALKNLRRSIDPARATNTTKRGSKRPAPDADDTEDESQAFETQQGGRRRDPKDDEDEDDQGFDRRTTPGSAESEPDDEYDELPIRGEKTSPRKASMQKTNKSASPSVSEAIPRTPPQGAKDSQNTRSETTTKPSQPQPEDDEETASEDDEL